MKLFKTMAAAVIAAGSLAFAPPVFADPGKGSGSDLVDICKFLVDNGIFYDTVGECMGENRRDDEIIICQILKEEGLLEAFGFKSHGDCVSFIRHNS